MINPLLAGCPVPTTETERVLLEALQAVPEGQGNLLDSAVILASSDVSA